MVLRINISQTDTFKSSAFKSFSVSIAIYFSWKMLKPWKDFRKINMVFNLVEKCLRKRAFSFDSFLWASKENE